MGFHLHESRVDCFNILEYGLAIGCAQSGLWFFAALLVDDTAAFLPFNVEQGFRSLSIAK